MIVLKQTVTMFILMAAGAVFYRTKLISNACGKELSRLLITVIIPCVIVKSYAVEFSQEKLLGLGMAAAAALLSLAVAMAICHVVYGKRRKIENFAVSFSNAGFVGIPLVSAVLGEEAVFYVSIYVALLNLLQQTYGVMVMTENPGYIRPGKVLKNPVLCALALGLILFLLPGKPPALVMDCVGYIAALNTPVAMIILGIYLAQTPFRDLFFNVGIYGASALRLLVIPLATVLALSLLPVSGEIRMIELIAAATPVGSNVAVFAQLHGLDYGHATKLVCNSTILSILTLPAVVWAASMIFY